MNKVRQFLVKILIGKTSVIANVCINKCICVSPLPGYFLLNVDIHNHRKFTTSKMLIRPNDKLCIRNYERRIKNDRKK